MEQIKSKVYIQHDADGRITRCEGGYTTPDNLDGWLYIDEGSGDRYNLCQSHYFEGGLYTMDGIPRYRWDGEVIPRTAEEIEADRAARPAPEPSDMELTQQDITDLQLANIEMGQEITDLQIALMEVTA